MTMRRMFIVAGILLIFFLAIYSWNRRNGVLDEFAANIGLEISGAILSPLRSAQDMLSNFWTRYFDLVGVRDENIKLKAKIDELEANILATKEDIAELKRLRALVQFPVDVRWRPLAARVLAGRIGPNAVLDSITISRGYVSGARPGTPLVTNKGLVGRVLRSSPHASTALLITDPGSRVAVFGQESRTSGILKGHGMYADLEVDFVQRDAKLKNGEMLITSGLDNKYPKGLPVAVVKAVAPSDYTQFMAVSATPLVDLQHLEEVLLLEKSGVDLPPEEEPEGPPPVFVGPPLPPHMAKLRPRQPAQADSAQATSQEATHTAAVEQAPHSENRAPSTQPVPQAGPKPRPASRVAPRYRIITP